MQSGQITVTTAGTEVRGTDVPGRLFSLVAHPDNTDTVWIGNDGSNAVSSSSGYPLQPAGAAVIIEIANLNHLWVDADVSGEKVCWARIQ